MINSRLLILIGLMAFYGCNSQINQDKKRISNFIDTVILKDILNKEELFSFLNVARDSMSVTNYKLIEFNVEFLKNEIQGNEYQILTYKEFKENRGFQDYIIHYKDLNKVYCIVRKDRLLTVIIVDNDRVISFFTALIKNKNRISPLILTEIRQR